MGVPERCYVNDIKADLYDENTLYVALDNHKEGDYKPYLLKSTDKGASWKRIDNGLGDKNLVWRIVQDHVDKNLMFLATEFGIYFTVDGGERWTEMNGGIPTISFRDLAIQRRENDLVAASFGRGFYILDDYTALRNVDDQQLEETASLFEPRKAWWYIEKSILDFDDTRGSQGAQLYMAPNPNFGAIFTYYLKDEIQSLEAVRQEREESLTADIPFPGWEALEDEAREMEPFVYLEIKDQQGRIINRVKAENKAGFNRAAWDLRVGGSGTLQLDQEEEDFTALLAAPGDYTATLHAFEKGKTTPLAGPVPVKVERLGEPALEGSPMEEVVAFWRKYEQLTRDVNALSIQLSNTRKASDKLFVAASKSSLGPEVMERISKLRQGLDTLDTRLNGNPAKNEIGERVKPTIGSRLFALNRGISTSTYGPTPTHEKTVGIITTEWESMKEELSALKAEAKAIGALIVKAGGPWVEGL